MPKQLFEQTTHFKNWIFSAADLEGIRDRVNQQGCESVVASVKLEHELGGSFDIGDPISQEEQVSLCQFFESKIIDYCKVFKFDISVQATSIMYFKRFYVLHTVMDYDPKLILLTSLFLSAKVENAYIQLDKFLAKIPKPPAADILLELEFELSKGLNFELNVHHPYWPLYGLFLDIQTYFSKDNNLTVEQETLFLNTLAQTYATARDMIQTCYLTDVPLIYMPSQIAWAFLRASARRSTVGPEEQFVDIIEEYYRHKLERECERLAMNTSFTDPNEKPIEGEEFMKNFFRILDDIEEVTRTAQGKPVDKEKAKSISIKVEKFRNLKFDHASLVFKKIEQENQMEKVKEKELKLKNEHQSNPLKSQ